MADSSTIFGVGILQGNILGAEKDSSFFIVSVFSFGVSESSGSRYPEFKALHR